MLELHYNFFDKLCDDNIFQELEMDTDSLYLALAEKYLFMYVSFPASEQNGKKRKTTVVETILEQMRKTTFSQVLVSTYLCLCSKICCCYDSESQKYKFSNKGLNKRALEDSGDDPMAKYRQVLDEAVNLKSTIRGFKTINHSVAT